MSSVRTVIASTFITLMAVAPAFAEVSTAGQAQQRMLPEKRATKQTVNGSCVATAVGVREDSLIIARTTHNTAVVAALGVRKNELMAAWNLTDAKARRTAREAAWSKFRSATETARKALRADTNAAYTQFNTAVKACGVAYTEQPTSSEVQ